MRPAARFYGDRWLHVRPKGSIFLVFTDVDKNEDACSSTLQEVQELSTRSPHLTEIEYVESRHFLSRTGDCLGRRGLAERGSLNCSGSRCFSTSAPEWDSDLAATLSGKLNLGRRSRGAHASGEMGIWFLKGIAQGLGGFQ
jgi:hypothetical protein